MTLYRRFFDTIVSKGVHRVDDVSLEYFLPQVIRSIECIPSPFWDAKSQVSRGHMEHVLVSMALAMAKFSAHKILIKDLHRLLCVARLARQTPVWTPTEQLLSSWAKMLERAVESTQFPVPSPVYLDKFPVVWTEDLGLNLIFLARELQLSTEDTQTLALAASSSPLPLLQDKKEMFQDDQVLRTSDIVDFRRDAPWAVYLDPEVKSTSEYAAWFEKRPPKEVADKWMEIMSKQNNMSACMHPLLSEKSSFKPSTWTMDSSWISYLLGHQRMGDFYWCLNPTNLMEILVLKMDKENIVPLASVEEYERVCKHARHQLIRGLDLEPSKFHEDNGEKYRLVFVPRETKETDPQFVIWTLSQTQLSLTQFLTVPSLTPDWSNERWKDFLQDVRSRMDFEDRVARSRLKQIVGDSTQDIVFSDVSLASDGEGGAYRIFRHIIKYVDMETILCERSPLVFSVPNELMSTWLVIRDEILKFNDSLLSLTADPREVWSQPTDFDATDRNKLVFLAENTVHNIIPSDQELKKPFNRLEDTDPVLLPALVAPKPEGRIKDELLQVIKKDKVPPIADTNKFLAGFITDLDGNMKQCSYYQGLEIAIWKDPIRREDSPNLFPHEDDGRCMMGIVVFLRLRERFFPCGLLLISNRHETFGPTSKVLKAKDVKVMKWIMSPEIRRTILMLLFNTFITLIGRVHRPETKSVGILNSDDHDDMLTELGFPTSDSEDVSMESLLTKQAQRSDPVSAMFQRAKIKHDVYLDRKSKLDQLEKQDFPDKPKWEWIKGKTIGQGAYGKVYICTRPGDTREYAMKNSSGQARDSRGNLAMMIAGEAGISPKLIDFWTQADSMFYVMELVPGSTLGRINFGPAKVWIAFREKLEALGMQGISLDDLHEENVMIFQDPHSDKVIAKIIDLDNPLLVRVDLQYTAPQRSRIRFPDRYNNLSISLQ